MTVVDIGGGKVRIGVTAPKDVAVHRVEVKAARGESVDPPIVPTRRTGTGSGDARRNARARRGEPRPRAVLDTAWGPVPGGDGEAA